MPDTYTREEIKAAFTRWLKEMQPDWPETSDPERLMEVLCDYMDEARQKPEPI